MTTPHFDFPAACCSPFVALIAAAAFSAATLAPAADATWSKNRNASLTLVHGIPGDSLGATRDLPVQVRVYRLFDNTQVFNDVTYKTVAGPLSVRPGFYRIQVRVNGTSDPADPVDVHLARARTRPRSPT